MNAARTGKIKGALLQTPFDEAKLRDLFQRLSDYSAVALAVSGGTDSTALMLLVKRWLDSLSLKTPAITILTVDHGLRKEAAAEARWVKERSAKLGFSHRTLVWTASKPVTALQAAARRARYDLLAGFCRDHSIQAMVTAHTSDDQAETMMMRLARGSGLDGLSGMAPATCWDGIDLLRPLLGTSRADLEAFLRNQHHDWLEDPTNQDENYERVRVRSALKAAKKLGISNEKLSLSAHRLGRARKALEIMTADFLKSNLTVHEAGFGEMDMEFFFQTAEELALRSLARMIKAFGGSDSLLQLSKIEEAYVRLKNRSRPLTLGGCQIALRRGRMFFFREYGRMTVPEVPLAQGKQQIWDGRFSVELTEAAQGAFTLRALGADGIKAVVDAGGDFQSVPGIGALALPSIWRDGKLAYAPCVHFAAAAPENWISEASANFHNTSILFANCSKTIK